MRVKIMRLDAALVGALLAVVPGRARADYKAFAHTYPHFTQPEGNLEMEWWVGAETYDHVAGADTTLFEHRLEIEYGLTSRWDMSLYEVFQQPPGGSFTWDSLRLETRYQITRKNLFPVDLLGYLEYERPADLHQPDELEAKLIVCKDVGPFLIQTNWIDESKLTLGQDFGFRVAMNGGVAYEVSPAFRFGVEALFDWERDSYQTGAPTASMIHVGPSLSAARGKVWAVATPDFRVEGGGNVPDRGRDIRFRLIVGVTP